MSPNCNDELYVAVSVSLLHNTTGTVRAQIRRESGVVMLRLRCLLHANYGLTRQRYVGRVPVLECRFLTLSYKTLSTFANKLVAFVCSSVPHTTPWKRR